MAGEQLEPIHLGDGAYATWEGYYFWLAANHHLNKTVALEPSGLISLIAYARQVPEFDDMFRQYLNRQGAS